MQDMIDSFLIKVTSSTKAKTPATEGFLNLGQGAKLSTERREALHSSVAKGLFLSKRAQPDIHQAVAVLATCVKEPNKSDWIK